MWCYLLFSLIILALSGVMVMICVGKILSLVFIGIAVALIMLFSWNVVGDHVVLKLIFRAEKLSEDDGIVPILEQYFNGIAERGLSSTNSPVVYQAVRNESYYIPLSEQNILISSSFGDRLIEHGDLLLQNIPDETYYHKLMICRKIFLLSIISLSVVPRILKYASAFCVLGATVIITFVLYIVGICKGDVVFLIGSIVRKVIEFLDKLINAIQDIIVGIVLNTAKEVSIQYLEQENRY